MTITCPKCRARLKISDEKAGREGTRVRCAKCGAVLIYKGKVRKEAPEREEPGDAKQTLAAAINTPHGAAETEGLSGEEERPSVASLTPSATEISSEGQEPTVTAEMKKARQTIHHDKERPSRLILPVIP